MLFTGDVATDRPFGEQVNDVYMHLIEKKEFIMEWRTELKSIRW
jgi:hypothetical protein